jgi:hypothetical protein
MLEKPVHQASSIVQPHHNPGFLKIYEKQRHKKLPCSKPPDCDAADPPVIDWKNYKDQ